MGEAELVRLAARVLEYGGIAVIVAGAFGSLALFGLAVMRRVAGTDPLADCRSNLGRSILLGLEFLVAADIINTVAIEPTLNSLAVLAGIVLIRTFLSFSLEVELENRWPWQRPDRPPPGGTGG